MAEETVSMLKFKQNLIIMKVDPLKVVGKVISGNMKIATEKVDIKIKEILSDVPVGPNETFEVYELINNSNQTLRVFTVGHGLYNRMKESHQKDGKYSESCLKGLNLKCDWCRQSFSDIPWQLPVRYDSNSDEGLHIFHGEGTYCSEQCMYGDYALLIRSKASAVDSTYRESYNLILLLRNLRYKMKTSHGDRESGGEDREIGGGPPELIAAPHWKLLCHNGGPLSEFDFYKNKRVYTELPGIVTLPTKKQYFVYK